METQAWREIRRHSGWKYPSISLGLGRDTPIITETGAYPGSVPFNKPQTTAALLSAVHYNSSPHGECG